MGQRWLPISVSTINRFHCICYIHFNHLAHALQPHPQGREEARDEARPTSAITSLHTGSLVHCSRLHANFLLKDRTILQLSLLVHGSPHWEHGMIYVTLANNQSSVEHIPPRATQLCMCFHEGRNKPLSHKCTLSILVTLKPLSHVIQVARYLGEVISLPMKTQDKCLYSVSNKNKHTQGSFSTFCRYLALIEQSGSRELAIFCANRQTDTTDHFTLCT